MTEIDTDTAAEPVTGSEAANNPEALALAEAWRLITEPLRAPLEDWAVTDAEAALSQQHLAALTDDAFDTTVYRMAIVEQGKFLRRLMTETDELIEAPEAVRAFVERVAAVGSVGTIRTVVATLRRHALGRLLEPLGRLEPEVAQRLIVTAGGRDAVAAAAVDEAIRARAGDDSRARDSLLCGLEALLHLAPPADRELRNFAIRFVAQPFAWNEVWANAVTEAIDRAARPEEAEGNIYDRHIRLDLPYREGFTSRLIDAIRRHRPHPPAPFRVD